MISRNDRQIIQIIRELAHRKWEQQGRPSGQDLQIWLESEREFKRQTEAPAAGNPQFDPVQEASEESFPASDAPAWNTSSS